MQLWWAARDGEPCAVAAVLESPGKTGMLFFCPPQADGVDREALEDLLRAVSRKAVDKGLSMIQKLLTDGPHPESDVLRAAGYGRLAELVYMRRDLAEPAAGRIDPQLTWRRYGQYDLAELSRLIEATYEESQDCPELSGVRRVGDTIAGHKAAGRFSPRSWWIASLGGRAAGCVLVNDSAIPGAAEVVYVGVTKPFRRQGVGRALLRQSIAHARERRHWELALAVDSRNIGAIKLYESEGFRSADRRVAYVMLSGGGAP